MVTKRKMSGGMCSCPCHKGKKFGKGLFLFLLGLVFLLNNLERLSDKATDILWPLLVLLFGLGLLVKGCCKCCSDAYY